MQLHRVSVGVVLNLGEEVPFLRDIVAAVVLLPIKSYRILPRLNELRRRRGERNERKGKRAVVEFAMEYGTEVWGSVDLHVTSLGLFETRSIWPPKFV